MATELVSWMDGADHASFRRWNYKTTSSAQKKLNLVAPGKNEVDFTGEDWVKLVHFEDFLDVDADDHFRLQDLPLVSHLVRGCIIVVKDKLLLEF